MTVVRRYLVLLILAVILGTAAGGIYSWTRPDLYRSTTRLFFTTNAVDVTDVYQATLAGQQRVRTYAVVATDPTVLVNAIQRSGAAAKVDELRANLHIDVPPGTIIMDLSVDNANPLTAAKLANAEAEELIALVGELERPLGGGPPPVSLTVVQPGVPNPVPQARINPLYLAAGAGAGLIVGFVLAFLINKIRRRGVGQPDAEDVEDMEDAEPDDGFDTEVFLPAAERVAAGNSKPQ
jgi:capsular polysaccharide biosynthesis protein